MSSNSLAKLGLRIENLKMDRKKMTLNFPSCATPSSSFAQEQPTHVKPNPPPTQHKHDHCSHNIVHMLQKASGTLRIGTESYDYGAEDLFDIGELGRGNFGTVNKMLHKESNTEMAVKRIRAAIDEREQKQLLKELDIVMKSTDCPFIVEFYGAIFNEGDCWICMELMTTSADKVYKAVHKVLRQKIPEEILGKIAYCVIKALDYLKTNLNIIHRDVKPSNILLDADGHIKLCDFGISGQLEDSIARTRDAGCQPYMAPERIDPIHARSGYDVRSDVWSLGLTLIEIARGRFPYPSWSTIFEQLDCIVIGDSPQLQNTNDQTFTTECLHSVNSCMIKDFNMRPKYPELLTHPFIQSYEKDNNVKAWFTDLLRKVPNIISLEIETESEPKS